MAIARPTRHDLVRHGQRLEYFTIAYNTAEGLVSIVAGIVAGSVSLIGFGRSEEHTSELQSLRHLVCRLLLEKKKNQRIINAHHATCTFAGMHARRCQPV